MTFVYRALDVGEAVPLLLVLVLLLRGPARKFPVVLGYVVWELLTTAGLTSFDMLYGGSAAQRLVAPDVTQLYAHLYWSNDVIVDLLRFFLVIILIYKAAPEGAQRLPVGRILGGVMTVVVLLPFFIFPMGPDHWPQSTWFNSTSELLNFGAAIMNLVLWGTLIANRNRDPQLAAVSVGLGIVVTGAAISYGFRHLLPSQAKFIPNLFLMLTQIVGWSIWCRAFWPAKKRSLVLNSPLPSPQ
jgi:hypothetical protein